MSKVRIHPRFYIFLIVLIIALTAVIILSSREHYATIQLGAVGEAKKMQAVIVREESVVTYTESYQNLVLNVAEGDVVSQGDIVAYTYSGGLNQTKLDELAAVQEQIRTLQTESMVKDEKNADLQALNDKVAEATSAIGQIIRGESDASLLEAEKVLRAAQKDRQLYLREHTYMDTQLQSQYTKEQALIQSIDNMKTNIIADSNGRITMQVDTNEAEFTKANLDNMTPEIIQEFIKNKSTKKARTPTVLFRIVNPFSWYVLAVTNDTDWVPDTEAPLQVRFEGSEDTDSIAARVTNIKHSENKRTNLYVLEMNSDIGTLINTRTVNVSIGAEVSGLMVPEKAISMEGTQSVVTLRDGHVMVPVKVLTRDGKNAVIESLVAGALHEGQTVVLQ